MNLSAGLLKSAKTRRWVKRVFLMPNPTVLCKTVSTIPFYFQLENSTHQNVNSEFQKVFLILKFAILILKVNCYYWTVLKIIQKFGVGRQQNFDVSPLAYVRVSQCRNSAFTLPISFVMFSLIFDDVTTVLMISPLFTLSQPLI